MNVCCHLVRLENCLQKLSTFDLKTMTSATPSPKSPDISEKSKKYDRQLRLWGDHGQYRLESSHVCLINANATGTEILKSLVLPGCGRFTIIDNKEVTEEDVGNNFFLESSQIGQNRGECAKALLNEMNLDVSGEALNEDIEQYLCIYKNSKFFDRFSVVIASELSEKTLKLLSRILWEKTGKCIPFIYCHCIGFIGWIRVQLREHTVVESHPDSSIDDLRLDCPFQEMLDHFNSMTLTSREEVVKTPWLVIFYKVLDQYVRANASADAISNNGTQKNPYHMNGPQKREFKDFLEIELRKLGLNEADDVFAESMKAVNTALSPTCISSSIRAILEDDKVSDPQSSQFWIMCAALKAFIQDNNGNLPVRGVLPDMTAESAKYISLQNVYREKAKRDAEDIYNRCQAIMEESGYSPVTLKSEEVQLFCKEARNLHLIRGQPIYEELESIPASVVEEIAQNQESPNPDCIFYVMMRGALRYYSEYNFYPGAADPEQDVTEFKACVTRLLTEWNCNVNGNADFIQEMCRYGGAEIPSVAAFIGGCVAQEAIKIMTSQYIPLNNTLIYNAIDCSSTTFVLPKDG